MRRYSDIVGKLLVREQLLLGWKIGLFILCGALLFGSIQLLEVNFRSTDVSGTVMPHGENVNPSEPVAYLIVKLDSGETVRAVSTLPLDYRPGQRAVVRQISTNFFGYKKHEFSRYLDKWKPAP
jgi:hypothetical protein